jgi:hypothetical protein
VNRLAVTLDPYSHALPILHTNAMARPDAISSASSTE